MLMVVHFRHGGISMAPALLSVIAFSALVVLRFVLPDAHRLPLVRAIAPRQHRRDTILEEIFHISDPGGVAVIGGNRFENSSDGPDPIDRTDCANAYLRRVVALTGPTQMGDGYVLEGGTTRFHARKAYIRRTTVATQPTSADDEKRN